MSTEVYFHPSDRFPYQPVSLPWMLSYISLSFVFFYILGRWIISSTAAANGKELSFDWLKHNTLLSFIHASLSSLLLILAVVRAPEIFADPLSHSNHFNYGLIAFSIGYFLSDFVDCLHNATSSIYAILLHHIVVITFFTHVLLHTRNLGYALYALSLEINSVFLHARRLLRWYSPSSRSMTFQSQLRTFIDLGNYVTFVLFRFGIILIGLRALHVQRDRLDPVVHVFTVLITSAIGVLNLVLFYRLVRNQISRASPPKSSEARSRLIDEQILLPS